MFLQKIGCLNINGIRSVATQSLFKKFLRSYDVDIMLLQEINDFNLNFVFSEYKYFVNLGENERGTAIIYRSHIKPELIHSSPCGRILSIQLGKVNIINLYAPSGSQHRRDRKQFYANDIRYYLKNPRLPVIIGGDFNCVLNVDDQNSTPINFSPELQSLCKDFNLVDVWKHMNGNKKEFTYFRNNTASRLDRVYVSQALVTASHRCTIVPASFSDHSSLLYELRVDKVQIPRLGKGFWKLNSSLLPSCKHFKDFYTDLQKRKSNFKSVFDWWFRVVKPSTKRFFTQLSIDKSRQFNHTLEFYQKVLINLQEELNRGELRFEDFLQVKHKIKSLEEEKLLGNQVRSSDKTLMSSEKTSLYHLVREKNGGKQKQSESLVFHQVKQQQTSNK